MLSISIILMLFAAFTDKSEHDRYKGNLLHRLVMAASVVVTLAVVASALYVSFTPVGHYTVNGCQWRYILPVLFPGLYVIGSAKIKNGMNKKWTDFLLLSALSLNAIIPFVTLCL